MSVHAAFDLVRDETIPEIASDVRMYRHKKTGAEVMSYVNGDENKVFGITFKTPPEDSTEIPLASVEMKLPDNIRDSLPQIGAKPAMAPVPVPVTPAPVAAPSAPRPGELVKEVTIPLNLSLSELKGQRKLKLRITLDVDPVQLL